MRSLALLLIIAGAIILGCNGYAVQVRGVASTNTAAQTSNDEQPPIYNAPAIGAIAIVGGLILLLCIGRTDE